MQKITKWGNIKYMNIYSDKELAVIAADAIKRHHKASSKNNKKTLDNLYFITGCTGFLGMYILSELNKNKDLEIGCLVRNHWQVSNIEKNMNKCLLALPCQRLFQLCRDQDSNLGCLGHNEKY